MEGTLGEVRMFAGNFAPKGWALCDGQLLSLGQHSALFSILGTIYGGDGRETFALPDLRGRAPIHRGTGHGLEPVLLGQRRGRDFMKLEQVHLPSHSHEISIPVSGKAKINLGANVGHTSLALNNYFGFHSGPDDSPYTATAPTGQKMHEDSIDTTELVVQGQSANSGSGREFGIRNPVLALNFIICLEGIFPSRS